MYSNSLLAFENDWSLIKTQFIEKIEREIVTKDLKDVFSKEEPVHDVDEIKLIKIRGSEYMKYYTMVYEICIQNDSNYCELLYNNITKLISQFILNNLQLRTSDDGEETATQESESIDIESSEEFSKISLLIIEYWIRYNNFIKILNGIFSYLNRFYVQLSLQPNIYQYSLAIFQLYIFQRYKGCVRRYLLNLLDRRRAGDEVNNLHVTLIIDMYHKLDSTNGLQFIEELEPYIINNYTNYYNTISKVYINDFSLSDFTTIIDSILNDEVEYYNKYISKNHKVHDVIINNLLYNNQTRIKEKLKDELPELLQNFRIEDVKLIYKYVSKLENVNEIIVNTLTKFVDDLIKKSNSENCMEYEVIRVYNKYLKLIQTCFEAFLSAYNNIFTKYTSKELISYIVDQIHSILMDSYETNLTFDGDSMDLDSSFDKMDINCYVKYHNNVIETDEHFVREYKAYLLKRMLSDRVNLTNEVSAFKSPAITTILSDFKRSKMMSASYESASKVPGNICVLSSFNVSDVLDKTNGQLVGESATEEKLSRTETPRVFGTLEVSEGAELNTIFSEELENYREHYKTVNRFKDLRYVYTSVVLEYGTIQIECNLVQATMLLLFNEANELKVEKVCEILDVQEEQVEKIVKSSGGILMQVVDTIRLNTEILTSSININPNDPLKLLSKDSGVSNKLSGVGVDKVFQDESVIDCKIVRIMKDRKSINLKELVELVSEESTDPEVVRVRINHLVNKEYISVEDEEVTYLP